MLLCCRKRFKHILRATVCLQSVWRMYQQRVRYLALLEEEARRIAELEEEERKRQALEEEERERRQREELERLASSEHTEAAAEGEALPSEKNSLALIHLEVPADLAFTLHCIEGWCAHVWPHISVMK